MPTPPLLDLDALIAPVPGPDPAGKPVPFAAREQLETARKELDPGTFSVDDPLRPAEEQRADWGLVIRVATETLTQGSKDLLVSARLTEALTKRYGFAGVRDGLALMRRLVEDCWDRIYPPIEEEDDAEVRAAAFNWLSDQDRGARFPHSLRATTLVPGASPGFCWRDWKESLGPPKSPSDTRPAELKAEFEKSVLNTTRADCQSAVDDLKAAQVELDALDRILDTKMAAMAPALSGIREALGQCLTLSEQVLAQKGPAPSAAAAADDADDVPPAPGANGTESAAASAVSAAPRPTTRAQLYQQIAETSAALKRIEPHSPIPYLLERAVELGALPFPELMKVLVRNPEVLSMMNRELGIRGGDEVEE